MPRWSTSVQLRVGLGMRLVSKAALLLAVAGAEAAAAAGGAPGWTLVAWNDLGMHCMDDDFAVFSLLPPFNTIHAQLTDPSGSLAGGAGFQVTYEPVSDPDGSRNASSAAKTNFWDHVTSLFGVTLAPDRGLAGFDMPGPSGSPRPMRFDPTPGWWSAEGIPITPTDDGGGRNPYPLMRLVARNTGGAVLATTDIVLPVSDEMDCRACHASGAAGFARPAAGWANDPDPDRDHRRNILQLHDERNAGSPSYVAALAARGYASSGLHATALGGTAVLCAGCHASNALPGSGLAGVSALTSALHDRHAGVLDPRTGATLGSATNRAACYSCHPGSTTRCLRGAMGSAVAADGTLAMQCQSCHGDMQRMGGSARVGWLDEPSCQACHTGTATRNNGQIRYTDALEPSGAFRTAVDATFATNPNVPLPGFSLYRYSFGHGGLACQACHGSTHAEFPATHRNDNLQSIALQGHPGVLAECSTCHASVPSAPAGGPHGLHPIGAAWVEDHGDVAEEGGVAACRACHGLDDLGTELSRALGDRQLATRYGTRSFFRGARISCWACHQGPSSDDENTNRPAVVADASASTQVTKRVAIPLAASDPDGNPLAFRVISQPAHGTVALAGNVATYGPEGAFTGDDAFTVSAWDGAIDSNLATVRVKVRPCPDPVDHDADGIGDACDDCPYAADPDQVDRGGVGPSAAPDGVGDACQCGDVNGDGRVTLADATLVTRALLQPATAILLRPERCDVGGAPGCGLADAVLLRRALLTPPRAGVAPVCAPARP